MTQVFPGSEALRRGDITRHELRRWHRSIYPDVYVEKRQLVSLHHRIAGAWLWSRRRGVVAGVAASAVHGARWVADDVRVELIWNNGRPPPQIIARNEQLGDDEVTVIDGLPVTTLVRTAFDLPEFKFGAPGLERPACASRRTAHRHSWAPLLPAAQLPVTFGHDADHSQTGVQHHEIGVQACAQVAHALEPEGAGRCR
jgi:hypothetical protein